MQCEMICFSATGTSGPKSGGSSVSSPFNTPIIVSPANALCPATISYNTSPRLKMSDLASTSLVLICSGDM